MENCKVRVKGPATSANLGAGFDCFGLALEEPYDIVEVSKIEDGAGVKLFCEGFPVPSDPSRNTGGYVALRMIEDLGLDGGVEIKIRKGVPPGSGLGSSAATAAAVAYALDKLYKLNLPTGKLLKYASLGETVSAGVPHLDNVAPALLGGFTVIAGDPPKIYGFKPSGRLGVAVILPETKPHTTRDARRILPSTVGLKLAYRNVAYGGLTALGLILGRVDLLKEGMRDEVVEPKRASYGFIPFYTEIRKLAEKLEAGVAVSGAGPAYIALSYREKVGEIAEALKNLIENLGGRCKVYVTRVGRGVCEDR